MATLYRVKNWADIYENNRTKELKRMDWLPLPNQMAADAYTELLDHPNGTAHYGAWMGILHVASSCAVRGTLLRTSGIPHDLASLARITRMPIRIFMEAIPRFCNIGWLESINYTIESIKQIPQDAAEIPQDAAEIPQDAAQHIPLQAQDAAPRARAFGTEEKVEQRNGSIKTIVQPPTLESFGWKGVRNTPDEVCERIIALRDDVIPEDPGPDSPYMIRGRLAWFEEFWMCYWRRKDKKGARVAHFAAVRTLELHDTVIEAVIRQAPEMLKREERFRPMAATWLHHERWNDESAGEADE